MKLRILVSAMALIATHSLFAAAALNTQAEKFSYAIGNDLAQNFHKQGVDIAADAFKKGFDDGLKGVSPGLTEAQKKQVIMQVQQEMMKKQQAKMKAEGAANEKAGTTFLAENAKKKGVKTTTSGLQYEVITEGKGVKPKATDTVKVDYEGTLIGGKVFDSSYKRGKPAEFKVNQVIKGWTEALQMMAAGSTWRLFVPAKLAYGDRGLPGIPPNSVLIFKVHLISIEGKK